MPSSDNRRRSWWRAGAGSLWLVLSLLPVLGQAAGISLERDLHEALDRSRAVIEQAKEQLEQGRAAPKEVDQIRTLADRIRKIDLMLREKFRLREEALKTGGAGALARHRSMASGVRAAIGEYLDAVEGLQRSGPSAALLQNLLDLIDRIHPRRSAPILGALPYRNLDYASQEPDPSPAMKPAYKGGNKTVGPDDLKNTPEAPIDGPIATLAQSLNWNPVSIYEYVKNNVETEWYWGCMKGAEETLRQKSGNDCDQASLLAALMRASGFPTRYVRGTIEFFPGIARAMNLTGIQDPLKVAELFRKAGIPFRPVVSGGTVANFQMDHLWVESQIPYSNYRGAVIDGQGKTWLGLDTAIKVRDYLYSGTVDAANGFDLSGVRGEYLASPSPLTPLDYLKSRLLEAGYTLSDVQKTRTLPEEVLNILPAGMQFEQRKITREYTEIPEELRHRVKFTATTKEGTFLFDFVADTLALSNRKIALGYEPESVEDQQIINAFGGLYNTPSYLVRLRPVLLIDDQRVAVGQDGLPMGEDFHLVVDAEAPRGTERIAQSHVAGALAVIVVTAQQAADQATTVPPELRDPVQTLQGIGLRHTDVWNRAEAEIAALLHLSLARPLPTVVTVGNVVDVTTVLGVPHEVAWKGVYVDAGLRAIEAVPEKQVTDSRSRDFMQLSALHGSILENLVLEEAVNTEAISTAKLLALANASGMPVLTLTKDNSAALLPALPFSAEIKKDIADAVNQDFSVKIPDREIDYRDWQGVGYIKEDPATGEAGYMLSGRIAGGMTAVSPQGWAATETAERLGDFYAGSQKPVSITFPRNGSTLYASPITVQGLISGASTRVSVNGREAEVSGKTFQAQDIGLLPGVNRITASVTDPTGATGTDLVIVNYEVVLKTYISLPFAGTTLSISPIDVAGVVSDPAAAVVVNGVAANVSAEGRFVATGVALSNGENKITAKATRWDGQSSSHEITVQCRPGEPAPAPISLSITSPQAGAVIDRPTATVSGSFASAAGEVWIKVNGIPATTYGNRFAANDVPIGQEGAYPIVAEAQDSNGAAGRTQIAVTVSPAPLVRLSANVTSGIAPLTVYFAADPQMPRAVTNYRMDFDGDGVDEYDAATFDNVSRTYELEGAYFPRLTVTDDQGNVYTNTIGVVVVQREAVLAALREKWDAVRAALLAGNIESALAYFVPGSQPQYDKLFKTIGQEKLVTLLGGITEIRLNSHGGRLAECGAIRVETGGTYSYPVTFVKDYHGMWKIHGF